VLIHAGDFTNRGSEAEIRAFNSFLKAQPHKHKLVIAGNHDFLFETLPSRAREALPDATYLEDESIEIDGVRFYGTPWQPWFSGLAFNLQRGAALAEKWARIPEGTDVLISHSPPAGILDANLEGQPIGCADLLTRVRVLRPKVHLFGHAHPSYGSVVTDGTTFVNAALCAEDQSPLRAPIVIDVP
jgi:Icc-related predicted phosphoesterase